MWRDHVDSRRDYAPVEKKILAAERHYAALKVCGATIYEPLAGTHRFGHVFDRNSGRPAVGIVAATVLNVRKSLV